MRLLRLDLRPFGEFADVSLELGRADGTEPGVTIVYGPNEAGKSTALRAILQLFFGIADDADGFRFGKNNLRIAGLLRDENGDEQGGTRRGTRADWLYDADDKKRLTADSPFAKMVARLDGKTYETVYGLDHDGLKAGAETIAATDGSLDATLAAATTRLKDLQAYQEELKKKSDALFVSGPNAKREIHKLLAGLKKLRDDASQTRRPIDDYHRLRDDIGRVQRELQTCGREKGELAVRLSRLERCSQLFGDRAERASLSLVLESLEHVPLYEGDLDSRREELIDELRVATVNVETIRTHLRSTETELRELGEPSPLSIHVERIEAFADRALLLESEGPAIEEAQRGRTALTHAVEEALAALGDLAQDVDLERLALPKSFAGTVRTLVNERLALDVKDREDRGRVEAMEKRLAELKSVQTDGGLDERISRLEERVRTATEALENWTPERDRLAAAVQAGRASIEDWIEQRFVEPVAWERLPNLPAPSLDTIEDEIGRRRKIEERLESLAANRREIETKLSVLRRALDAARDEGLPTAEDLVAARSRRDETLRRLKADVFSPTSKSDLFGEESISPPNESFEKLTKEVREADRLADVLAQEADRCAKLRQDREEATALEESRTRLEAERREIEEAAHGGDAAWTSLWKTIGASAASPKEMRTWRRDWEDRVRKVAIVAEQERERDRLDQRIREATSALAVEVRGSREKDSKSPDAESLVENLALAHGIKRQLETVRTQIVRDLSHRENTQNDLRVRLESIQENSRSKAAWEEKWKIVTQRLPAASRAVPSETLTFLEQFAEWRRLRDQERKLDDRIAGYQARKEEFAVDVKSFTDELGMTPGADIFAQVRRWKSDSSLARQRDAAEKGLCDRLDRLRGDSLAAEKRLRLAEAALQNFSQDLGLTESTDLSRRIDEIRRRRTAMEEASKLDARLRNLLPDFAWSDLDRELSEWSPESLDAEIASLRTRIDRVGEEEKDRFATLRELQKRMDEWNGEGKAAEIEQRRQRLISELSDAAEQYAIYRLATAALEVAVERYRERNKSPILERASRFFSLLTADRYEGLQPHDRPEGGIAVLGLRAGNGEPPHEVPVSGMSRGTCDQLYLAFRMALWEERLEKGSPLPIVLDDVLVHFDDERAAATLKAFDELAKRTQIVYFTHHRHLVELAQKTLPAERLLVRELSPPNRRT